jgi:hypothetical protein
MGLLVGIYMALGGAALGLVEFGVGAMLWSEQKLIIAVGAIAALCGHYLGWVVIFAIVGPHLG